MEATVMGTVTGVRPLGTLGLIFVEGSSPMPRTNHKNTDDVLSEKHRQAFFCALGRG